MLRFLSRAAVAAACCAGFGAQAATVWDETVHGDLSSQGLAPTFVAMSAGGNRVVGTMGNLGQGVDRDYLSFTVPVGSLLSKVMVLDASVSGGVAYFAIQAGPQLTVSTDGAGWQVLLGGGHFGNDTIGADLLAATAINFSGALGAGTYSVWVQETGGPASYDLDFQISAVPEPTTAALLLAGMLALGRRARRR